MENNKNEVVDEEKLQSESIENDTEDELNDKQNEINENNEMSVNTNVSSDKKNCKWSFLMLFVLCAYCAYSLYRLKVFPRQWLLKTCIGLLATVILSAYFSFSKYVSKKKVIGIINIILSIVLISGSLYVNSLENDLRTMFVEPDTQQEVVINFYTMNKGDHSTSIEDYLDKKFIVQKDMDYEKQKYALEFMKSKMSLETIHTVDTDNVWNAAKMLYDGEGDVMMVSDYYLDYLMEHSEYKDFKEKTKCIYSLTCNVNVEIPKPTEKMYKTPFNIYVAGNDQPGELRTMGRFDVNMILTVNPNSHEVLITSIPRDSYIANPDYNHGLDKLTHMGVTGVDNSMEALSDYFDIDIDNYVIVNFSSFLKVLDAIGGVDIYNPYAFVSKHGGCTYPAGEIHLEGEKALTYCRERYNLSNGDFDRNEHQMIVIKAILKKVSSTEALNHADQLLNALNGTMLTNIPTDELMTLASEQVTTNERYKFVNYHISGVGAMEPCAAAGNQVLAVVYPNQKDVDFIKEQIHLVLDGKTIEQKKLPSENK